ncbi:MAG: hypothetical protein JWO06_2521 [Bacteroidota bacterium]|nr:hypothetical protein [Bacteroidota bacterium]
MGMFLALSGVIGKSKEEVANALAAYAKSAGGGLEAAVLTVDISNCCIIDEDNGNTTVLYPNGYMEWDKSSKFISATLNAAVFSFHIHDGDLWMYILYANGETVDMFNPLPDYWDEVEDEEMESFKGNATVVAKYVPGLSPQNIEKYLVRWVYGDPNTKPTPMMNLIAE